MLRKAESVDAMTSEQAKDLRVSGALKSLFFHGVVIMFCFKKGDLSFYSVLEIISGCKLRL